MVGHGGVGGAVWLGVVVWSPGREAFRPIALVASDDEVGLFSLGHGHAAFIPACVCE